MSKLSHAKVRKKMLELNWKQEALAEALGITERHVRNLCYKDTNCSIELGYKISRLFGTTMEELLAVSETTEDIHILSSSEIS